MIRPEEIWDDPHVPEALVSQLVTVFHELMRPYAADERSNGLAAFVLLQVAIHVFVEVLDATPPQEQDAFLATWSAVLQRTVRQHLEDTHGPR